MSVGDCNLSPQMRGWWEKKIYLKKWLENSKFDDVWKLHIWEHQWTSSTRNIKKTHNRGRRHCCSVAQWCRTLYAPCTAAGQASQAFTISRGRDRVRWIEKVALKHIHYHMENRQPVGNCCTDAGSSNLVLCDNVEGWDGVGWGGR